MPTTETEQLREYFSRELGWGQGHQARAVFDFLMNAATFCRGEAILDAGAGHQRYKPFFRNCIYLTQEHQTGVAFKGMQAIPYDLLSPLDEKIQLADNSLTGILSTSVIEHVRRPERFLAEAFRVLKPGGRVFINVPFAYPEHETPYDFSRPTRYGLTAWLRDAGFADIAVKPSSSGTETSAAMFPYMALKDALRTDEGIRVAVDSSTRQGRLLKDAPRFILALIAYYIAQCASSMVRLMADAGPYDKCLFPVGWIATAQKPGTFERTPCASKEEFLKQHRLPSGNE